MKTDVLKLIKERATVRKYKNKSIPKKILDKIIEAGIWGPSVPSFLRIQPWFFVVITNKSIKKQLSEIVLKKSKNSGAGVNILLHSASNIIKSAPVTIAVYNSGDMDKMKNRFKEIYSRFSGIIKKAEFSAISAAIQNMILGAESCGIGSCWLDTPLFCKEGINKLLKTDKELIAILTFGYPAEKGKRSIRKNSIEAVKHIK
ncbi:MAG: nitroreductase family protein [Candidatus Omnitrophica bacterium]|nr:nitroreductase family protein [Candidatus Omnitrophota bacterium]